ncbi:hypothetical protein RQM47_02085 [Rubrivirga sp. S365]|uniref:EamA-like transporter family protein n=1 Tax=Rubrivirga litoralis TaxID=3075598 RepID=A0ABU3BP51_9BACT|nr:MULTISPECIES: hypothetical protein [unclassified Rubrivirga]MDT0631063.1 hypothetical protein [Rubrivirga sp. F394]MDT7855425.1 hypothetical protein [Rubrivirga sp. S365]
MTSVSPWVTAYAVLLAAAGAVFLFVPDIVFPDARAGGPAALAAQLFGAALLGFAALCWAGRGALLGGIYGRPIVVGNQAFAVVGTLVVLGGLPPEAGPGLWGLLAVLVFGAALWSVLLFRSPRRDGPPPRPAA